MYRAPRGTSPILYAVMHVNVGPEVEGGARGLANYLNNNGPTGGFGAKQTREWCNLYGLPIGHVNGLQIANREKGICGHVDVNMSGLPGTVWPGGHYDPGPNFPWDVYLPLVNGDAPTPPPVPPKPKGHELTFFFRVPDAATDAGRKDVYVSNGIVYERTTADQLKALLFVAGGQGLPTNIGTMTKAQIGNMERVGP